MRQAGILLAVSSLPSRHGIGDFGPSAYEFIRYLRRTGMRLWQVLPLNPLGYGNSPYQPYSSMAMDEIYISLDLLVKEKLLVKVPSFRQKSKQVNYQLVRKFKDKYLKKAFKKFIPDEKYVKFIRQNKWVRDYAVFITLKHHNNDLPWNEWPTIQKRWIDDHQYDLSPLDNEINYAMFLQYMLIKQWRALKRYANRQAIKIVGDIPFYVGIDSLDVWSNKKQFLLDEEDQPTHIAGVPPDFFSKTGQRWGNPLYDWDYMKNDNFTFWIQRLRYTNKLFDIIRIDHFRAFDTYWKIPASSPTAEIGEWIEAPGYQVFDQIFSTFPRIKIIAEDLGELRPEVLILRDHYDLPGMKIVQFRFEPNEKYLRRAGTYFPRFTDRENMVIYTGTHDNQTIYGWYLAQDKKTRQRTIALLKDKGFAYQKVSESFCEYTLSNIARYAFLPMQDVLSLSDKAKMNTPGTIGDHNWAYKMDSFDPFIKQLPFLKRIVKKTNRL
jgi:4-alpha-glucanotransferase